MTWTSVTRKYLPGGRAGNRARVVEGIFAKHTLIVRLVECNQPSDHRLRWSRLRVGNGLLEPHAVRFGVKRNVRQAVALDALAIAEAQIHSPGPAQIRSQPSDEKIVIRAHCALN